MKFDLAGLRSQMSILIWGICNLGLFGTNTRMLSNHWQLGSEAEVDVAAPYQRNERQSFAYSVYLISDLKVNYWNISCCSLLFMRATPTKQYCAHGFHAWVWILPMSITFQVLMNSRVHPGRSSGTSLNYLGKVTLHAARTLTVSRWQCHCAPCVMYPPP